MRCEILLAAVLISTAAASADWISSPAGDSFAFEKRFSITNDVLEAKLKITAPGFYEAYLNGLRIGDRVLDPSPTDYTKRVYYSEYPVNLTRGEQSLKVLLGHGWYDQRGLSGWSNHLDRWRDRPCLWAELNIRYRDGSEQTISSDASWRSVENPVFWDDFREGEIIDPGLVRPREAIGIPATVVNGPAGALQPADFPPARIVREIRPVKVWPVKAGGWMVDFGVDLAGWARLKIRGCRRGDIVTIRYDERIQPDGEPTVRVLRKDVKKIGRNELWPAHARTIDAHFHAVASTNVLAGGAFQQDRFICTGAAEDVYEPRFTYKGFRYIWVQGAPTLPEAIACEIRTDFAETGSFECSDADFTALMRMVDRSYKSNFTDGVPTDCPHREKNGWTGDAYLACEYAQYAYENSDAYVKWIRDLVDAQRADGNLPGIVPSGGWGWFDAPNGSSAGPGAVWGSVIGVIPWTLYVYRDDVRGLDLAYPALVRFLDFEASQMDGDGLLPRGLADWIPMDEADYVDHRFCGTAQYFQLLQIARRIAMRKGDRKASKRFEQRADETARHFNAAFRRGDGVYGRGSQTEQSLVLNSGLVPESERKLAERALVAAVHARGDRFYGGVVASKNVFRALSRAGETALAFKMLKAPGEPGYMHWKEAGGTALWEDWWGGFSRNHVMFADFAAWAYQYLAGIRLPESKDSTAAVPNPKVRGFKQVVIAPDFIDQLDFVTASVATKNGKLVSSWKRQGGVIEVNIEIPAGVKAMLILPWQDEFHSREHELRKPEKYKFRLPAKSPELSLDVETGNPIHTALRHEDVRLVVSNVTDHAIAANGTLVFSDVFKNSISYPLSTQICANAVCRLPLPSSLDRKGTWEVLFYDRAQASLSPQFGLKTSFAILDSHPLTPKVPRGTAFRFGLNSHFQHFESAQRKIAADAMAALGIKFVRSAAFAPGAYRRDPDEVLSLLDERGISLMSTVFEMKYKNRTAEHCRELAEKYGTRIDYYETGNEWDMQGEWTELLGDAVLSREEAVRFQQVAYEAIKTACPSAVVSTCAFALASSKDPRVKRKGFQEELLSRTKGCYDVHTVHLHGETDWFRRTLDDDFLPMRRKLGVEVPWFSGETALPSARGDRKYEAPRCVWQKAIVAWSRGSIDYIWYILRADGPDSEWNFEHSYGVFTKDWHPLFTAAAVSSFCKLFNGAKFEAIEKEADGTSVYRLRRGDDVIYVGWMDKDERSSCVCTGRACSRDASTTGQAHSCHSQPVVRVTHAHTVDLMGNETACPPTESGDFILPLSLNPSAIILSP